MPTDATEVPRGGPVSAACSGGDADAVAGGILAVNATSSKAMAVLRQVSGGVGGIPIGYRCHNYIGIAERRSF